MAVAYWYGTMKNQKLKICGVAIDQPKCETSGCAFSVEHDTNDENKNTGGARVLISLFATGRSNILAPPNTKSMIFKVMGADLEHKAAIFIEGYTPKGLATPPFIMRSQICGQL